MSSRKLAFSVSVVKRSMFFNIMEDLYILLLFDNDCSYRLSTQRCHGYQIHQDVMVYQQRESAIVEFLASEASFKVHGWYRFRMKTDDRPSIIFINRLPIRDDIQQYLSRYFIMLYVCLLECIDRNLCNASATASSKNFVFSIEIKFCPSFLFLSRHRICIFAVSTALLFVINPSVTRNRQMKKKKSSKAFRRCSLDSSELSVDSLLNKTKK